MSGRHFGHYKAASKNAFLTAVHSTFCTVASECGTSIDRWERGLTVMLEKIKGNIRADKLRAILLMEADFNFIMKELFSGRLTHKLEKEKLFPREILGGRKGARR